MNRRLAIVLGASTMALLTGCPPSGPAGEAPPAPTAAQPAPPAAAAAALPSPSAAAPKAAAPAAAAASAEALTFAPDIAARVARQVPVTLDFDEALIPADQRAMVKKVAEAALIMDGLFLRQVDEGNPALKAALEKDPAAADALALFDMMAGPWDRLDENKPFVGERSKPAGAGFYPGDVTKADIEAHLQANPGDRKAFESYFTVIRRVDGTLQAIPYSTFYGADLARAATLLDEAAALAKDERLKRYLTLRAESFRKDDYFESDMAWMDLGDGFLELVIGPYEVYEDGIMAYKAAFEAFVCLRDPKDSERLASIMASVPWLEKRLPMPAKYTVSPRGQESPLSVVIELLSTGDTRAGVQTLAFNLPNDERVRAAKGSKKVLLKNVAQAKFEKILLPIARQLMAPEQVADVTFDAFFNHTLLHETAHGMGPGILTLPDGSQSDVNRQLSDLYSTIEEAKADILGLWASHELIDRGDLDRSFEKSIYASLLAGFFRSVRFGAHEAHGKANLIQFNWMVEKGGIVRGADGRYSVDYARIRQVSRDLAEALLIIEAEGSYSQAKAFIEKYGQMPAELSQALASLQGVPVDIRPHFALVDKMRAW